MTDDAPKATDEASPSFEAALGELESIVHDLEGGEFGLAESLARYEQGVKLLRRCFGLLERAERKIELLSGVDAEGNAITESFDDEASLDLSQKGEKRVRRRDASRQTASRKRATAPEPATGIDEPEGLF